jgi:hypothetical protein
MQPDFCFMRMFVPMGSRRLGAGKIRTGTLRNRTIHLRPANASRAGAAVWLAGVRRLQSHHQTHPACSRCPGQCWTDADFLQKASNVFADGDTLLASSMNSNGGRTLELLMKHKPDTQLTEIAKHQLVISAAHSWRAGTGIFNILMDRYRSLDADEEAAKILLVVHLENKEIMICFLATPPSTVPRVQ